MMKKTSHKTGVRKCFIFLAFSCILYHILGGNNLMEKKRKHLSELVPGDCLIRLNGEICEIKETHTDYDGNGVYYDFGGFLVHEKGLSGMFMYDHNKFSVVDSEYKTIIY
jgi:hypothetical protein